MRASPAAHTPVRSDASSPSADAWFAARPLKQQLSGLRFVVGVLLGPAALLLEVLLVWGLFFGGVPLSQLTREPLAVAFGDNPPNYYGAVSTAGGIIWSLTAGVCVFAASLLRSTPEAREQARFLLAAGVLTVALLLDDVYMLHDVVYPTYLHLSESKVGAIYALAACLLVVRFRQTVLRSNFLILGLALSWLAASLVFDHYGPRFLPWWMQHLAEDGCKLLGILAWAAYFVGSAREWLQASSSRALLDASTG